ncbi:dTMP kinase [Candidatus Micrarchaeota archaeon]|nr:dTMP kinase [Candidatus Micrarchaeota archaeon]
MAKKGKLVVFEGLDGSGKSAQIDLLKEKFPELVLFKFPTRNYPMLNDYLEKKISIDPKSLFLLFLADIAEQQQKIKESLDAGKLVVLDRYVFSTIAYECNGIDHQRAKKIVESVGYLVPDLVILLDIDGKTSQERKKKQKQLDRYEENIIYLDKVRENFLKLDSEKFLTKNWHKINANKDISQINKEILALL